MEKHIMLAFVSSVASDRFFKNPIPYNIQGKSYNAIQTNESAIVYVERMLEAQGNSLSKIFLIASNSVKNDKISFETEFGSVTALEFLERRIKKEFSQLDGKFSVHNYSDSTTALDENILQTAEIADAVMSFAREHPADKITVHADMTGGFRHASMLMLSIIQLLKYRGVKIGEILYSDPDLQGKPPKPKSPKVYPVGEIQRMFSLITGADEFVKFGSVESLNEYFGEAPPPAVKTLLSAMNRFAEAIKICRTSMIESELKNLGQHITKFREHPDKDLRSELFAKITDTVEREYGELINGRGGRLEIIRWCMRKGFWQQAMTLCTEWLPEELIVRKICEPANATLREMCMKNCRSGYKTWQQYFIIDCKPVRKNIDKDNNPADFCESLRDILVSCPKRTFGAEKIFDELKKFFDEYSSGANSFEMCKRKEMKVNAFKQKFPMFAAVLQAIFDKQSKRLTCRKNFYEFLRNVEHERIPTFVANLSDEELLILFKIDRDKIRKFESVKKTDSKWDLREKEYRKMFAERIICSRLAESVALEFLHGYYSLRHERNQINHADAKSSKTIAELRTLIERYLDELEQINPA